MALGAAVLMSGCGTSKVGHSSMGLNVPVSNGSSSLGVQGNSNRHSISLSFEPVQTEQRISKISHIDTKHIVKQQSISSGTIIIFTQPNDARNLYGAFKTKNAIYHLGVVGGRSPTTNQLISITPLHLFGKTLVRIKGVFGANTPLENYFEIRGGKIHPFLRVATGNTSEVDLDNDGTDEIISSWGTLTTTYVYKRVRGQFYVANINKALGATAVLLNSQNIFNVWFTNAKGPIQYQYKSGTLTLRN